MDGRNTTILLVEDDIAIQQMYIRKFDHEGFTTVAAATAGDGLQLARGKKPDIILLDVMLGPGMNGFDVLETLKRDPELKDVPVIMMTNLNSEEQVAREIGAADYIVKADVDLDVVVGKIKSLTSASA